jgi:L,D-peptidoglycan transpeptidase YkuD (ErfK/YbiS/YcfS/YnhG family)
LTQNQTAFQNFGIIKLKISPRLTPIWIFIIGFGLLLLGCQDPPEASLVKAKLMLKQAANAGALRYAEEHYHSAENLLKDGWMEMARQKGRLAPFRNYHNADSLLMLAVSRAQEAAQLSQETIHSLDSLARSDRDNLREEIQTWREALDGLLENFSAEHYWADADMALQTSQTLIAKGEYEAARDAVKKGKQAVQRLEDIVAEYANEEAQGLSVWRRWVDATIANSRANGTIAIIIDKSAHKTYLVSGGKLIRTFKCDLGYNSARQKLFAGDGATPEGMYYVSQVKYSSKYYRALLINYPNAADNKRFRENKNKRIITRSSRIGSLIEIHGNGVRNEDWTNGCVALTNKDMDQLMQYAKAGTPVTIVRKSDRWP